MSNRRFEWARSAGSRVMRRYVTYGWSFHHLGFLGTVLVGSAVLSNQEEKSHRWKDPASTKHFVGKGRPGLSSFPLFQPVRTSLQAQSATPTPKQQTVEYDFVVLGNGNAGRSAVETLQKQCPSAKIALVDPLRPVDSRSRGLDYYASAATGFLPSTRTVQISDASIQLKYRHGILVATGCRGAPPPLSLIDSHALDRILELRSTEIIGNRRRPVLPPQTVRQLTLMAASQGATVCIMGSGWEAIELAAAASEAGSKSPVLTFGSAGPLSHVLPRYLSTEVSKRLRQQGITTLERSMVRYVAVDSREETKRLEVHTARSYDLLDSQRNAADLLVVAPYVTGPRGTAVLSTNSVPGAIDETISYGNAWYQSWSQLSSTLSKPSSMVCYADDGRILVNAELSAASRVYAAGSAAKYPSSVTGHAHVAGEGSVDGALAGRLAAMHMSRDFHERKSGKQDHDLCASSFASESLALWRSDKCTYLHGDMAEQNALGRIGIRALCIGTCDSERLTTHGYFWTNRRLLEQTVGETASSSSRRLTRRRKTKASSQLLPVYGTGVVFYVDKSGHIQGVMTWGLPFTSTTRTPAGSNLNQDLIIQMKALIGTNAGVSPWELESDAVLRRSNLMDESRALVGLALSRRLKRRDTTRNIERLNVPIEDLGAPLYRYTVAKPAKILNIGVLRRKDHSRYSHLMGENLYIKDSDQDLEDVLQMPSLTRAQENNPLVSARITQIHEELLDQVLYENELRARPPKEEPLWLRRGDAHKGISLRERMSDNIYRNVRRGRFADGTDAVKQAGVPKAYRNAKERLRRWMTTTDETDVDEEEEDWDEDDEVEEQDDS